jgi:hypothetical protein
MESKALSSDTHQRTDRSRRRSWLPGILLAPVMLLALFAMGGAASAQEGPEDVLWDPWATQFCTAYGGMTCAMGDFNGDGRDDIVQFNRTVGPAGDVYVRLASGSSFEAPQLWHTTFGVYSNQITKVGDFNGDGFDDIIVFTRGTAGEIWVALSNGYN